MRSEREKMLAGELYDPLDPELVAAGSVGRATYRRAFRGRQSVPSHPRNGDP